MDIGLRVLHIGFTLVHCNFTGLADLCQGKGLYHNIPCVFICMGMYPQAHIAPEPFINLKTD